MDELFAAVSASAAPLLIGGAVERLQLFLEPLQPFRDRVRLRRTALVEQLASKHALLLESVKEATSDEPMRGYVRAPQGSEPDRIGEFTSETFRLFAIFHRLEVLGFFVRAGHGLLLLTTVLGLIGVVLAFFVPPARATLVVCGLTIVAVQVLSIASVYFSARKLDDYEDVT
jgi:hypothetical protein